MIRSLRLPSLLGVLAIVLVTLPARAAVMARQPVPDAAFQVVDPAVEEPGSGDPSVKGWLFLAVVIVAGGVMLLLAARHESEEPEETVDESEPEVSFSVVPESVESGLWLASRLDIEPAARMEAVAVTSEGYIAVGHVAVGGEQNARVWVSKGGMEWFPAGTLEVGIATGIMIDRTPMVVGQTLGLNGGPVATVWIPGEPGRWNRITSLVGSEFEGVAFERICKHNDVFLALVRHRRGMGVFSSGNGAQWRPVDLPATTEMLIVLDKRVLSVGRLLDERRTAVFESIDGERWNRWPEGQVRPFELSVVETAVPFAGGWVAGGADSLKQVGLVLVSDDEVVWHRVPHEFGPGTTVNHLVVVGEVLVAVVTATRAPMPPSFSIWCSSDAVAWIEEPGSQVDGSVPVSVIVDEDRISIYGHTSDDAVVTRWLSAPLGG